VKYDFMVNDRLLITLSLSAKQSRLCVHTFMADPKLLRKVCLAVKQMLGR
jgi:hypothetical protein